MVSFNGGKMKRPHRRRPWAGKGDKQRPSTVPREDYEENWDRVFKKPNEDDIKGKEERNG